MLSIGVHIYGQVQGSSVGTVRVTVRLPDVWWFGSLRVQVVPLSKTRVFGVCRYGYPPLDHDHASVASLALADVVQS